MPEENDDMAANPEEDLDRTLPINQPYQPSPGDVFRGLMALTPLPSTGSWQALTPEELDRQLPDFKIVKMLGRGGMGAVYEAIQKSLDRPVAIKVLPPEFSNAPEFETRFRREAKAMARLNHPNIIQIHDFGQTEQKLYFFVMEYVGGADLHQMIRQKKIDPDIALKVVIQVCEALQYAHDHGYVHRDIKPANILLTSDGLVKVGDFGLAKLIDPNLGSETEKRGLTSTGDSMGTPNYVAPEQINGNKNIDHRADIYSLGVMFYEMLTGEIPRGAFAPPSRKIAIDVRIDDVVLKAMQEEPEMRYQSARDVESDVEIIRTTPRGMTKARLEKTGAKAGRTAGKKGWAAALASLLVLVPVAASVVWKPWERFNPPSQSPPPVSQLVLPPALPVPPALAAMKKRGGILKVWSAGQWPGVDYGKANGVKDFVALSGEAGKWVGLRANGSSVSNLEGFDRADEIVAFRRDQAVLKTGEQVTFSKDAPPVVDGVRDIVAACESFGGIILLLTRDGKVVRSGGKRTWTSPQMKDVIAALDSTDDAVQIDQWGETGIVLKRDGSVIAWSFVSGTLSPPQGMGRIVGVAVGWDHLAALDENGKVHAWGSKYDDVIAVPRDLPKVYAIRVAGGVTAAQIEDGSWRAWGNVLDGLSERINELGPAVDIWFSAAQDGLIRWIEPVPGNPVPAMRGLPTLPGRLRGVGYRGLDRSDQVIPVDVSAGGGFSDFVQVTARFTNGDFAALRTNGTVVSSAPHLFQPHRDVVRMGQRSDTDSNLVYIDSAGKITLSQVDGRLMVGNLPEVENPVIAATTSNSHGLLLLATGRAVPWGEHYFNRDILGKVEAIGDLRFQPSREKLEDVVAVDVSGRISAVLKSDGSVLAWGDTGEIKLPVQFQSRIVEIDTHYRMGIFARDDQGQIWQSDPEGTLVSDKPVAFGNRLYSGAPPVYRNDRGEWSFYDPAERQMVAMRHPEVFEAMRHLKNLPPEAFHLSVFNKIGFLYWIEP